MTLCPSEALLDGLLNEDIEGMELAQIEVHVETCLRCQGHLDDLTRVARWQVAEPASTSIERPEVNETIDQQFPSPQAERPVVADARDADPDETLQPDGAENVACHSESRGANADHPTIPGYEILQRLGRGGHGRRLQGPAPRPEPPGRPEDDPRRQPGADATTWPGSASRPRRSRGCGHPNIVQIYDIGEADGLPFVSLELLEGGGLDDRLAGTPQPGRPAAELVADPGPGRPCRPPGRDHPPRPQAGQRPVHRRTACPRSPTSAWPSGSTRTISQTETGQIMGTPSYMAPEQARGIARTSDPAADIYALGAILYEMLTGRPPFKGETPMETVRQVIDDEPVPPSRLVPRVPRDLETICLKCLHKEPHKRYDSARALADDLERYLDGEPIKARPAPHWDCAARWARRNPFTAAAAVLVASILVATIVSAFRHEQSVASRQTAALFLMDKADAARSQAEVERAQLELSEFLPSVNNESRLKPIADRIFAKRELIGERLADMRREESKRGERDAAHARFEKFCELRDATQVYAAHLTVLDPAEHKNALRATAHAALAVFGKDPSGPATAWQLAEPAVGPLESDEATQVREGCYDLLLILSEVEGPFDGLKILDCAARLHPEPTTAYHELRALCLGRTNDKSGRAREEVLARSAKPTRAFDHLLIGREKVARGQQRSRGHLTPGDFREAIRSAETALQLDPNQLGAYLLLAVVQYNSGQFSEAKRSLNACFRTAPDLLGLYLFRARISGDEGSQALRHINDSAATAPEWKREAAKSFDAAKADYRRALGLHPDSSFRYVLLVNRGGMYLQADRLDQALEDLEAAVNLNPKLYHAHALLAQVYHRQGKLDLAARSLDLAIERQPELPDLFRARAFLVSRAHEKGGSKFRDATPEKQARAIGDLKEAIRLEPANSSQARDDHVELGRLFFATGQTKEALAAYEAAIRIDPNDPGPLRLRALALLELERFDEVLAASDAFLSHGKLSTDMLAIRGQARFARKDFTGAIADDTVALTLSPGAPELLDQRGWAYLFSEGFRLALADFDAAIQLDSGLGHAYSGRGLARVALGSWREALADADTAIRLASTTEMQRAL